MSKYLDSLVSLTTIQDAFSRITGVANKTPVFTSRTVNRLTGASVLFKCENFQRVGAFKFRGAYNALSRLTVQARKKGVITFSSGNHAQAIALSGSLLKIPTLIVMPEDAPSVKLDATRSYGAEIMLYNKEEISREELAGNVARKHSLTIIPPYDHPHVISGQGTTALEFFQESGELDILLVCCGGGGLLSGCAVASKALQPRCAVIGVEPLNANDATRSFLSGTLQSVYNPDTIADGARTPSLGAYTFPLVLENVDDMIMVSDLAIRKAMKFLWERMKLVVEPTGALATAALLTNIERFRGKRVGVIISGGNIDLNDLHNFFDGTV